MPLTDDELRQYYEDAAAQGLCAGKLKVGLDREADMRRIGIMRDALATSGKKPVLMVDSNEYWSPKQAIPPSQRLRGGVRHILGRRAGEALGLPGAAPDIRGRKDGCRKR